MDAGSVERAEVVGNDAALARRPRELATDLADALSAIRAGRDLSTDAFEAEAAAFGRLAVTDEARAALRAYRRDDPPD